MDTFYKTELGFRTLKLRDLPLNARQRRLLVLIGTDDFSALNTAMKHRIAEPDLLQQLIDLGLIFKEKNHAEPLQKREEAAVEPRPQILTQPSEIHTALSVPSSTTATEDYSFQLEKAQVATEPAQPITAADVPIESLSPLAFDELKQFMMQHLQQYCGLMAKQLILNIQAAEQVSQLKMCQIQWITLLQESRIVPKLLSHALQQVNLSMRKLQST